MEENYPVWKVRITGELKCRGVGGAVLAVAGGITAIHGGRDGWGSSGSCCGVTGRGMQLLELLRLAPLEKLQEQPGTRSRSWPTSRGVLDHAELRCRLM